MALKDQVMREKHPIVIVARRKMKWHECWHPTFFLAFLRALPPVAQRRASRYRYIRNIRTNITRSDPTRTHSSTHVWHTPLFCFALLSSRSIFSMPSPAGSSTWVQGQRTKEGTQLRITLYVCSKAVVSHCNVLLACSIQDTWATHLHKKGTGNTINRYITAKGDPCKSNFHCWWPESTQHCSSL